MNKQIRHGAVVALMSVLAACATKTAEVPPAEDKSGASAQTAPAAGAKSARELEMEKQQQLLAQTSVYFAFDSSAIDEQSRAVIEAHAAYLLNSPNAKMSLAGHCDERGTREYNLALGERRAQAVEKLMKAFGVPGGQLKTVSYGEEKPMDPGHDESAWRKNRRVELTK